MGAETLDAEVKARIPKEQKYQLQELADARQLKVADIIREAIRAKLLTLQQPELALPAGSHADNGR